MEKILALVFAATLSTAEARTPAQTFFPSVCVASAELFATLKQYEELPFVRGDSDRNGQKVGFVMFLNAQTGTWTIAERVEEDLFCVTGVGNRFEPVPSEVIDNFFKPEEKDLTNNKVSVILNNKIAV